MNTNIIKEIDIKNCTYCIFDDMVNIERLDPNKIKIDKKPYKNILIYHISYVKTISVKPVYLIINKVYGYTDEYNDNKYLTVLDTDKDKDI